MYVMVRHGHGVTWKDRDKERIEAVGHRTLRNLAAYTKRKTLKYARI
jgi:hypothetical protein